MQERTFFSGVIVGQLRGKIQCAARVGCFAVMAALFAWGLAGSSAAAGEGENPLAEVTPATILFPPSGGKVQAMLVLRNPTEETLSDVTIDVFPEVFGTDAIIDYKPGTVVLPDDESSWLIQIPEVLPHPVPAEMHIRIMYRTKARSGQEKPVSRTVSAKISLNSRAEATADKVVNAAVVPTTLTYPPDVGDAQAMLVLKNPTEEALSDVTIDVFPTAFGKNAIIDSKPGIVVPPNSEFTSLIKIPDAMPYPVPAKMHIRITYKTRAKSGEEPSVSRTTSATIEIAQREPENIESVASAEILTPIETLKDNEKRDVYISVTNKSNTKIEVCEITPAQHSSFAVKQTTKGKTEGEVRGPEVAIVPLPARVEPGETKLFPLSVIASEQVKSGKETLSLNVGIKWGEGGQGSILLKKEITLGVFGESEILTALGVPSLLMLPGYLFIVTLTAMWPSKLKSKPDQTTLEKWQQIVRPEILVLAIMFSGATMYGYKYFLGRDYAVSYGMRDIVNVWLASVAIGVGIAMLMHTGICLRNAWLRFRNWWYKPSARDNPIVTLRKLHRRGHGFFLPAASQPTQGETLLFQLDPNMKWVAPNITVTGCASSQQEATELEKLTNDRGGSAKKMADVLKKGQRKYKWVVNWMSANGPKEDESIQFAEQNKRSIVIKS